MAEDNPVRVIDVFVDELDLLALRFKAVVPETAGRLPYHPATLKILSMATSTRSNRAAGWSAKRGAPLR